MCVCVCVCVCVGVFVCVCLCVVCVCVCVAICTNIQQNVDITYRVIYAYINDLMLAVVTCGSLACSMMCM